MLARTENNILFRVGGFSGPVSSYSYADTDTISKLAGATNVVVKFAVKVGRFGASLEIYHHRHLESVWKPFISIVLVAAIKNIRVQLCVPNPQ